MKVFVTGASGWIGSATVTELIGAGHEVLGLVRSDEGAALVRSLGAEVRRGDLLELEGLAAAAAEVDAVVHMAYHHDFSQMGRAAEMDAAAIHAMGDVLAERGGALLIASGMLALAEGRAATEDDRASLFAHPRLPNAEATLAMAERGVRSVVVRFPPTVHGEGDHGFVATLTQVAFERGAAAYVGDGSSRWPAVHRSDAGLLVRLAVESAPAGSVVHAVAEEGVESRGIAEAIGRSLGLPTAWIEPAEATAHFGWIGAFFGADIPASSEITRQRFNWNPTGPTLIDDILAGHYAQ
jgi:nucleoside-diphosphate-sugar epimerase